jgi:hypothetical protein
MNVRHDLSESTPDHEPTGGHLASVATRDDEGASEDADGGLTAEDREFQAKLIEVLRNVTANLPDETTIGELVTAARTNPVMAPVLEILTVQGLIDLAVARPRRQDRDRPDRAEIRYDEEGNPILDLHDDGPQVVRRRADVPDGDVVVLRYLATQGAQPEAALARATQLTAEQLRLIVRHLKSKGQVHVEGAGTKKKIKITRNGSMYLRKRGG